MFSSYRTVSTDNIYSMQCHALYDRSYSMAR